MQSMQYEVMDRHASLAMTRGTTRDESIFWFANSMHSGASNVTSLARQYSSGADLLGSRFFKKSSQQRHKTSLIMSLSCPMYNRQTVASG